MINTTIRIFSNYCKAARSIIFNLYLKPFFKWFIGVLYLLTIFFNIADGWSQTVYVPSSHWVYEFLDRCETKGVLSFVLSGTKPLTRKEIAGYLSPLINDEQVYLRLSKTEQQQLSFLVFEFQEELNDGSSDNYISRIEQIKKNKFVDAVLPDILYHDNRNFLQFKHKELNVYIDPVMRRKRLYAEADTLSEQEKVFHDTNGFSMWGTIGSSLGFVIDVRDSKEWGTRDYPGVKNFSREGLGFARGGNDHLYHDETLAYVTWQWKYFLLQYGKDSNRWGPGYHGQLGLSDLATSYDLIKMQLVWPRLKFTSMLAFLQHYTDAYFDGEHEDKMLAAHRLEFAPAKWLELGMYEMVVFADRKFEPAYFNPVMFFRSAEHYLGDRDNAVMGLDWELKVIPKTKLYGELFIDDVTTKKLGTGFYGNKYGYTLGLFYVDALGFENFDTRLEWTRIRPFTYSHKDFVTNYRHFTTPLGHWLGPNAENLFFETTYRYSKQLLLKVRYEFRRHGADPAGENWGGTFFRQRNVLNDPEYVELLDGDLETTNIFGTELSYELFRNCYVCLNYNHYVTDFEKKLYTKNSEKRSEIIFSLGLNY